MKKSVVFTSLLFASSVNAYDVKNIEISSHQLEKKTSVSIVLPDSYSQGQEYAVVYVLHGWAGDQKSWLEETEIAKQADLHDLIIVLPDGGMINGTLIALKRKALSISHI